MSCPALRGVNREGRARLPSSVLCGPYTEGLHVGDRCVCAHLMGPEQVADTETQVTGAASPSPSLEEAQVTVGRALVNWHSPRNWGGFVSGTPGGQRHELLLWSLRRAEGVVLEAGPGARWSSPVTRGFCVCKLAYSLKLVCDPQISARAAFMVDQGHGQAVRILLPPNVHLPAEGRGSACIPCRHTASSQPVSCRGGFLFALLCPSLVTRLWKRPQAWCQRTVQCAQAAWPDREGVRMRCEPGLRSDTVGCEFSVKEATAPVQ